MPYVKASTANPTGWRPWNSRLSFYIPNRFPVPTTGRGPLLLQPGVPCQRPSAAGGLSAYQPGGLGAHFPNFATLRQVGPNYRSRSAPATQPYIYAPPEAVRGLSFMGDTSTTPATTSRWAPHRVSAPGSRGALRNQQQGSFVTSSPQTGSIVSYVPNSGTPIYQQGQQPNAGGGQSLYVIGTDANGNPIYSSTPGATLSTTPATAAAAPATSSVDLSTWFGEDSLGLGLNNGVYSAAAIIVALWAMKGKR